MLQTLESGAVRLEPDVIVDGVWSTVPDEYTPRRNEMLSEFVQGHLATRDAMDSEQPVEVWSITGEVMLKQKHEVTCTDWLRLLVREQALTSGARELAETALHAISRQPNEAWAAAAARVVKVYRAWFASADRPFMSETRFFWRFVTEADMNMLFTRLADVLMPNPFERNGVSGLLLEHSNRVSECMRKLRFEWHDPMSAKMEERGETTRKLFKSFADVLSARSVSCKPAAQKRGKTVGADSMFSLSELSDLFSSKEKLAALVASHARPSAANPAHTLAAMSLSNHSNAAPTECFPEPARPTVAAFQNQPASDPSKHGVPYETSAGTQQQRPQQQQQQQQQQSLPRPPADAPRSDVLRYLSHHNVCYKQAFSGSCNRSQCSFRHDQVPAGFYRSVSREGQAGGARPRRVMASLTEAAYETLAAMGLVDDDSKGVFEGEVEELS